MSVSVVFLLLTVDYPGFRLSCISFCIMVRCIPAHSRIRSTKREQMARQHNQFLHVLFERHWHEREGFIWPSGQTILQSTTMGGQHPLTVRDVYQDLYRLSSGS